MWLIVVLLATGTSQVETDFIVEWIRALHQRVPTVGPLFAVIIIDIVMGVIAAGYTKTLSSNVSYRGMCKKSAEVLLVVLGLVLDPFAGGVPVSGLLASFFLANEGLSILENAARCDIPIPTWLREMLQKSPKEVPPASPQISIQHVSNLDLKAVSEVSSVKPSNGVTDDGKPQ